MSSAGELVGDKKEWIRMAFSQFDEKSKIIQQLAPVGPSAPTFLYETPAQFQVWRIDSLVVSNDDVADQAASLQVADPSDVETVLGVVTIPAPVAPQTSTAVDLIQALSGAITAGIVLPVGWQLVVRQQSTTTTGRMGVTVFGGTL